VSFIQAIILAIIEGLTEFLPVSSTGHMIVASSLMGIASDPFTKLFTVAIQLGTILSVVVLYRKQFFQSIDFYLKIGIAFLPAAVIGILFKDIIFHLLERVDVVGYALLAGGVFFLFIDKIFSQHETNDEVTNPKALKIGFFQIMAMIPGISRSAATIVGGLSQKLSKKSAAEFSFFLAVPTMLGATVLSAFEYYDSGLNLSANEYALLATGMLVGFIVAIFAIKSFIGFLTHNGFKAFGYYRIAIGITILLLYYLGAELSIV
jgi:undecaprenyl-diphosphatase